ncbi:MAG: ATP-dependent Clp protease adaptor ClpS [Bacteroidales bacterium]|jgi:ATP-dependent Clp protease adaptor protein ClpS|nr:ATP-dependent Clp protease adaptor ClpS [Bacteroidales bacterium]
MDSNFSSSPNKKGSENSHSENYSMLVLHNDEVNSFEFVMETLEQVCNHTLTQAEQCAMITHYKGKCEILNGELGELKTIKQELLSRGLSVTIE